MIIISPLRTGKKFGYMLSTQEDNSEKEKFYALIEFPYRRDRDFRCRSSKTLYGTWHRRKRKTSGLQCTLSDRLGTHSVFLPKTYAIKTIFIPKSLQSKILPALKSRFNHSVSLLTGAVRLTQPTLTTTSGHSGFSFSFSSMVLLTKKEMNVNWCTSCKCVLANEEVVNGVALRQ